MHDLFKVLPEIIGNTTTVYGILALTIVSLCIISFSFFRRAETSTKKNIFFYLILFFIGAIIIAMTYSLVPIVNKIPDSETDYLVSLSSKSWKELNTFIDQEGLVKSDNSRSEVVKSALEKFLKNQDLATSKVEEDKDTKVEEDKDISSETLPIEPATFDSKTIISKENIKFTLNACERENTLIRCNITAINFLEDRKLSITVNQFGSSRLYDEVGNEYIAIKGSIANKESKKYVTSRIIQGVPSKIEITFPDIPTKVNKISLLEVLAKPDNARSFTLEYKNIKVLTQ